MKYELPKLAHRTIRNYVRRDDVVIVAPLNWGLGHASRCIPVIEYLVSRGIKVILASDGEALSLLKKEFPHLDAHPLTGYGIKYKSSSAVWNMLISLPAFIKGVLREGKEISALVQKYNAKVVISDNRFAARGKDTMNIYITHQVNIVFRQTWMRRLAGEIHRYFIDAFDTCWVPDERGRNNITGPMSYSRGIKDLHYIGHLSRIRRLDMEKQWDICVLLSGPEPQKSVWASMLAAVLKDLKDYKIIWINSTPDKVFEKGVPEHFEVHTLADSKLVEKALNASRLLISRSGYSTIMDIMHLDIPAIFVPTPGQPEQEYLAEKLASGSRFHTLKQKEMSRIGEMINSILSLPES
jgi:UDP:flavonoid glycosyltransferase YjiC (YdhE family)